MTRKELGKELVRNVISLVITVAGALIILSFTTFFDDKKKIKDELNRLDKVKIEAPYVDQKCLETKEQLDEKLSSTDARLTRIENKTDKILELMITQRK